MNHIEAMKQALEALELMVTPRNFQTHQFCQKAYDDLRQAIEQASSVSSIQSDKTSDAEKQEPVPWQGCDLDGMVEAFDRVIEAHFFRKNPFHNPIDADAQMALRILRGFIPYMKQYTTPQPQREWVGLTGAEKEAIFNYSPRDQWLLIKNTEAKLKEKNQ